MASEVMHKLLVRVCDKQMNERVGLLIDDAVRRPVTFKTRGTFDWEPAELTIDAGLILIGPDGGRNGVEDIRRHVGECLVKVLSTEELFWIPVAAHRDPMTALWSIHLVPLIEFARASAKPDEFILEQSGYDPVTRESVVATGWVCQCGEPNRSDWPVCRDCGTPQ